MADELDKFEAQLIAYLDGELSPAGALALERELAAHPQYRGLMEEMRQQRELLLGLPTEAAPEALKAQLRSQVAQAGPAGLSHRRLYRIAASILLMLGAGIVVHQLLPLPGTQAPHYAIRMESTPVGMELREGEALASARADERLAFKGADDRVASEIAAEDVESKVAARKSDAVPGVALAQSQQGRQQMFVNSSNIANSRTVISVASDNPTVMQAEIGRLLRDNRIAYSHEAEIPADAALGDVTLASAETQARDRSGIQAPYAGKGQGPAPRRGLDETAADAEKAKYAAKDADVYAKSAADAVDPKLNEAAAKSENAGKVGGAGSADIAKDSNAKPAAPTTPVTLAPLPNAARPAAPSALPAVSAPAPNAAGSVAQGQAGLPAQAAGERGALQKSLNQQQVLVARNVSSGDVAQIEQALRDRQVGQKQRLNYRVTETSNSQIAGPGPATASISQLNFAVTTQPAPTTSVQAKGGTQAPAAAPAPAPASQQPAAQQAPRQQAEQTMDLLIVVEPEAK